MCVCVCVCARACTRVFRLVFVVVLCCWFVVVVVWGGSGGGGGWGELKITLCRPERTISNGT